VLLLSASSRSFALLDGRGGPEGGELLGNASGAHRKEHLKFNKKLGLFLAPERTYEKIFIQIE
jgi:hypothetical protein